MTFYVSIKCPKTSLCFLVVVAVAFVCFVLFSVLLVFSLRSSLLSFQVYQSDLWSTNVSDMVRNG